tara:strand:- start:55 stop:342 length:288 start_codon:yes stop_codon:yes gene_type:complete
LYVSGITIRFAIKWSKSLKEKRSFTNSFKNKLQSKFNISISEIDDLDSIKFAHFGIVTTASSYKIISSRINKIYDYLNKSYLEAEMIKLEKFDLS